VEWGRLWAPVCRQTVFERAHRHPCALPEAPVFLVAARRLGARRPWVVEVVDSTLLARRLQEAAWDSIEPA